MKHDPAGKSSAKAMTKPVQTSNRYLFAREFVEPSKVGKQKIAEMASAPTDDAKKWQSIDWQYARRQVRRLQMRIAKAVQENRWNKMKILQYKLTHSFYAKAVAVKRVTSNKGKKTPGVDGVLWQGARAKWQAIFGLQTRGYHPQPLRRIYIEKKNGKKRPLSIPTMSDKVPDKKRESMISMIPMGELLPPIEIARAHLFLSSDEANFITGQTLCVDGGMGVGI